MNRGRKSREAGGEEESKRGNKDVKKQNREKATGEKDG